MDLVGKDDLLKFHILPPQALDEIGSLLKRHVTIIVAMDKQHGRSNVAIALGLGAVWLAMISVNLQSNARGKIRSFIHQIRGRRQVMDVYFLAGADDFILHVAARDTEDLRSFVVENLNADADVAGTQTSLIFEHLRGAAPI